MIIYHFCAAKHVNMIRRSGFQIGGVALPGPHGFRIFSGYTWLTLDGDPGHQSWATGIMIPYKRTAYRLTVEIPDEDMDRLMDRDALEQHIPGSQILFDGWPHSESWRVYRGFIPPNWIKKIENMEEGNGQV